MRDHPNLMTRAIHRFGSGRRRAAWSSFHYEHVLGTSLELRVMAARPADARAAEAAVLAEIDRLEGILSGYSANSELARWQSAPRGDVAISPELAEVLNAAEMWRARTNDAFNAAAQPIIDARSEPLPVRGPSWTVDQLRGTARLLTALPLSLDGVAKGYIVRCAAERGGEMPGVTALMLNIGGDIQSVGEMSITAGIANPFDAAENAPLLAVVRLHGDALASSGGYRRGFRVNGQWHSHIVDPRSGMPATRVVGASVIAPDCTTADALSTALSVLEPVEGIALADSLPGVGCLLVEANGVISANAFWKTRAVSLATPKGATRTQQIHAFKDCS